MDVEVPMCYKKNRGGLKMKKKCASAFLSSEAKKKSKLLKKKRRVFQVDWNGVVWIIMQRLKLPSALSLAQNWVHNFGLPPNEQP